MSFVGRSRARDRSRGHGGVVSITLASTLASATKPANLALSRYGGTSANGIYTIDNAAQSHLTLRAIDTYAPETQADGSVLLFAHRTYYNRVDPYTPGGAGWSATATSTGLTDPAGGTEGVQLQVNSGVLGPYFGAFVTTTGAYHCTWQRDHLGATSTGELVTGNANAGHTINLTAAYQRAEVARQSGSTEYHVPEDGIGVAGGPGAGARNADAAFSMCVVDAQHRYPFTKALVASPIAESVYHLIGESIVDHAGFIDVTFSTFYGAEPAAKIPSDGWVICVQDSAGKRYGVRFTQSTTKFDLIVADSVVASSAVQSYAADGLTGVALHPLRYWYQAGSTGVTFGGLSLTVSATGTYTRLTPCPEFVSLCGDDAQNPLLYSVGAAHANRVFEAYVGGTYTATLKGKNPYGTSIDCDGDSITIGYNLPGWVDGQPPTPATGAWPQVLATTLGSGYRVRDVAMSGQSFLNGITNFATFIGNRIFTARPKRIVIAAFGRNDLAANALTPAAVYANMLLYAAKVRAAGALLYTVVPISGSGTGNAGRNYDSDLRLAYRDLLLAGEGVDCDGVIRMDLDANIGVVGANASPTYFQDNIHPTVAGQASYAATMRSELARLAGI